MTTFLATMFLLGVLIFVHELGHFWAAKAVGIGVERFSIGLGPRVWGYTRGETEYVLSAVPLGGYVKMQGMEDEVMEKVEGGASGAPRRPDPRDFDSKPIWARAFVISAGVVMNMLFALAAYSAAAALRGFDEVPGTRVLEVADSTLPPGTESLARIVPGAEIVRIGDTEPETWDQILRILAETSPGVVSVVTESPAATLRIGIPEGIEERRALAGSLVPWVEPRVSRVTPGSAADRAAILPGDLVTSVAGIPVASWAAMVGEISARPGESVEIGVLRDGTALLRVAELGVTEDADGERGLLGVYPPSVNVRVGLGEAVAYGSDRTIFFTSAILAFLGDLVTLNASPRDVGSIGTIAVASGAAASEGLGPYLTFMAFISINLAVLNLLPIPVLDGGHLVFLGIELVRGEKLTVKQRIRWTQVGVVVLVAIMAWALGNDLLRFLGL